MTDPLVWFCISAYVVGALVSEALVCMWLEAEDPVGWKYWIIWPVWLLGGAVYYLYVRISEGRAGDAGSKPTKIPGDWDRKW